MHQHSRIYCHLKCGSWEKTVHGCNRKATLTSRPARGAVRGAGPPLLRLAGAQVAHTAPASARP